MKLKADLATAAKLPRIAAVFLAITGGVWAGLLGWLVVDVAIHRPEGEAVAGFAGSLVIVAFVCAPGWLAWYGYIRRAFGHFLFGWAIWLWLVSLAANLFYLFCWEFSSVVFRYTLRTWLVLAILLSVVSWLREGRRPESKKVDASIAPAASKTSSREL